MEEYSKSRPVSGKRCAAAARFVARSGENSNEQKDCGWQLEGWTDEPSVVSESSCFVFGSVHIRVFARRL